MADNIAMSQTRECSIWYVLHTLLHLVGDICTEAKRRMLQVKRWASERQKWHITSLFLSASNFAAAPAGGSLITCFFKAPGGSNRSSDHRSAAGASGSQMVSAQQIPEDSMPDSSMDDADKPPVATHQAPDAAPGHQATAQQMPADSMPDSDAGGQGSPARHQAPDAAPGHGAQNMPAAHSMPISDTDGLQTSPVDHHQADAETPAAAVPPAQLESLLDIVDDQQQPRQAFADAHNSDLCAHQPGTQSPWRAVNLLHKTCHEEVPASELHCASENVQTDSTLAVADQAYLDAGADHVKDHAHAGDAVLLSTANAVVLGKAVSSGSDHTRTADTGYQRTTRTSTCHAQADTRLQGADASVAYASTMGKLLPGELGDGAATTTEHTNSMHALHANHAKIPAPRR